MIQKGEGPALVHGGQPNGELGDLHRQRVLIHAVDAAVRHQPARQHQALFVVGRDDQLAGFAAGGLALWGNPEIRITLQEKNSKYPTFNQPLQR